MVHDAYVVCVVCLDLILLGCALLGFGPWRAIAIAIGRGTEKEGFVSFDAVPARHEVEDPRWTAAAVARSGPDLFHEGFLWCWFDNLLLVFGACVLEKLCAWDDRKVRDLSCGGYQHPGALVRKNRSGGRSPPRTLKYTGVK